MQPYAEPGKGHLKRRKVPFKTGNTEPGGVKNKSDHIEGDDKQATLCPLRNLIERKRCLLQGSKKPPRQGIEPWSPA